MEIVLLINLALNLTVDSQSQEERILLASGGSLVDFAFVENIGESGDGLAGVVHLLVYRVLEVAGEVLDLLDLLLQITAQTSESEDDILLNLTGLVRLLHSLFVIVTEQLESVIDSGRLEEAGGGGDIVGGVAELDQGLGSAFVVVLNLAEVRD